MVVDHDVGDAGFLGAFDQSLGFQIGDVLNFLAGLAFGSRVAAEYPEDVPPGVALGQKFAIGLQLFRVVVHGQPVTGIFVPVRKDGHIHPVRFDLVEDGIHVREICHVDLTEITIDEGKLAVAIGMSGVIPKGDDALNDVETLCFAIIEVSIYIGWRGVIENGPGGVRLPEERCAVGFDKIMAIGGDTNRLRRSDSGNAVAAKTRQRNQQEDK